MLVPASRARLPGSLARDAALALVVTCLASAELVHRGTGDLPLPLVLLVVALATMTLTFRRSHPWWCAAAVVGSNLALLEAGLVMDNLGQFLATLVAAWSVGRHADREPAWLLPFGLGVVAVGALAVIEPSEAAGLILLVTAASMLGRLLGRRTEAITALEEEARRLTREREDRARQAVESERADIARELHDVVAHSVSLMVLQTGAGRRLMAADPARAEQMLLAAESSGRAALAEMKRMVAVMREGSPSLDPQPGLDRLPDLVRGTAGSGAEVELVVEGEVRSLGAGLDLAAYRIVQEALTNSIRHGGQGPVTVRVVHHDDRVEVEVAEHGRSRIAWPPAEPGHGLAGMHERVALYQGRLDVSPGDDGLVVRAVLPREGAT